LILEYVPLGSLEDQKNVSEEECVTTLCQALSALVELHGRKEPIVHRDITPPPFKAFTTSILGFTR
jgi:hypothetical protein